MKMSKKARKRKIGPEDKAICEWEKDRILPENLRDEMETMWEIPQIYHFLQLTKEALNISHLSMYEVERMLLMPKASKQLAHIMTCLLSSPSTTKAKIHKVPPMPYDFWTNILMYKLRSWFKMYQTKHQDSVKVFDTIGVEPEFWKIFPNFSEIEGKSFLDFTFKQRVWLLKTVCDTALHSRKTLQDEISKQPSESQFETVLGIDRYGARYIYFPQFLHNDLRVYKHCLDNKVLLTVKPPPVEKIEPKLEPMIKKEPVPRAVGRPSGKRKRRKSRWSKGSLPDQKKIKQRKHLERFSIASPFDQSLVDSNSNSIDAHPTLNSRSSSKASSDLSVSSSFAKSSGYETMSGEVGEDSTIVDHFEENSTEKNVDTIVENDKEEDEKNHQDLSENPSFQIEALKDDQEQNFKTEETDKVKDPNTALITDSKTDDLIKLNSFSVVDDVSKCSKTDDEKLEEISSMNATKIIEKTNETETLPSLKDINVSKSDDEKLSESKRCDLSIDNLNDEMSQDDWKNTGKNCNEESIDENESHSENEEVSDSAHSNSGSRRSARIKQISEVKLEVEDAENMLEVYESEELSSRDLRDSLCRVSSPEAEQDYSCEGVENNVIEDFNELINNLSVSNFQLVADTLDSLKDLTEFISSDKSVPGSNVKFDRPSCEEKLLKRLNILCASLENVELILKESTKKARNKLQREWNNFENGIVEKEDQEADESNGGANRWLLGPQGHWTLETHGVALPDSTPPGACGSSTAASASGDEIATPKAASDFIETQTETATDSADEALQWNQNQENVEEKADGFKEEEAKEGNQRKEEKEQGERLARAQGRKERKAADEEKYDENETKQTKRVLRTRGISSYSEQLFFDDESEEECLDGWADIEAIYSTPTAQTSESTPGSPSKTRESCNDSDEEDSDQDWILPGSRKRKRKRQSSSRRLKTFQQKLQNMNDNNSTSLRCPVPFPSIDAKALLLPKVFLDTRVISSTNLKNAQSCATTSVLVTQAEPTSIPSSANLTEALPTDTSMKAETQDPSLHSVLDIKDEGPIYDSASQDLNKGCLQPNYVVVSSGPTAPVTNYFVMSQNTPVTAVVQPSQFIQPTTFVPQMMPQVQQLSTDGYYMHPASQSYVMQSQPQGLIPTVPNQTFVNTPQLIYQQPQSQQQQPGYVQYVAQSSQPRIINSMTLTPPRQVAYRMRAAPATGVRMPVPRQHPNGAVIRSAPLRGNVVRPGQRLSNVRAPPPKRQSNQGMKSSIKPLPSSSKLGTKTTSLIMLSDSEDEIEMIIEEKSAVTTPKRNILPKPSPQPIQPKKPQLPAELVQRMSEGNISISPIKPVQPAVSVSQSTQLVVVVNETGSHYALALPNGSKLILTPEQVAQIRASNGGKLVL